MNVGAPSIVRQVEFSRLHYQLQFDEDFEFSLATLLQLRRELRQAIELSGVGTAQRGQLLALLDPPELSDPVARHKFRKPGPGFAIQPPHRLPQQLSTGDELTIQVVFLGRARAQIGIFSELLMALGRSGISCGAGRFTLQTIKADVPSGMQTIWCSGASLVNLSVPYNDLGWWLDDIILQESLLWSIKTPARLMRQGKPLFNPGFTELFPYVLRRVTSMLYAWGGCDLPIDPAGLLRDSSLVTTVENNLCWHDWRILDGSPQRQELGGLIGTIELAGDGLVSFGWLLQLLALINLGKGAAYGAGQCEVTVRGAPGCQAQV